MTHSRNNLRANRQNLGRTVRGAGVLIAAVALSACSNSFDQLAHVGAFTTIDPLQRHPIIVSEEPANMSIRVPRGSDGLAGYQRANVVDFLSRYRGSDNGNGRLEIAVPSGSANEVAALRAVADLQYIVRDLGIDDSRVSVSPYRADRGREPAVRISYTRYVAQAPDCGIWPTNLANDKANLPHPNLGCATQRNFAMQVANPADLLGPRTMTPALAERRDARWEKFIKGDSTIAKKDGEERASTKSQE
jgi:pilus assembly protein CpaD